MAGKKFGNAQKSDPNLAHAKTGAGIRSEDAPHADDKRNAPTGDRSLKSGGGIPAKR